MGGQEPKPPNECPKCGRGVGIKTTTARQHWISRTRICECGERWSSIEITLDYFKYLRKMWRLVMRIFDETVRP